MPDANGQHQVVVRPGEPGVGSDKGHVVVARQVGVGDGVRWERGAVHHEVMSPTSSRRTTMMMMMIYSPGGNLLLPLACARHEASSYSDFSEN